MDIQVKFIDGEAYVPFNHVVNLVVTAQNEVARSVHRHYHEAEQKRAIAMQAQAQCLSGKVRIGGIGAVNQIGNQLAASDNSIGLGCHEEDYWGLSR